MPAEALAKAGSFGGFRRSVDRRHGCYAVGLHTKCGREVPMRTLIALAAVLLLNGVVVAQTPEQQATAPEQTAPEPAAPESVQVERIALGTGVESRELMGEATEFDMSAGRIYCWTKVNAQTVPTTIRHVWYAGEEKAADVPLDIKYATTRTWSSKAVWPGRWRVDVVSETGAVLASLDVTVTALPGPSGP